MSVAGKLQYVYYRLYILCVLVIAIAAVNHFNTIMQIVRPQNMFPYYIYFYRYSYDNEEFQHLLNSLNFRFENSGPKHASMAWMPVPLALIFIVSFLTYLGTHTK